jgi:hypothetical protein
MQLMPDAAEEGYRLLIFLCFFVATFIVKRALGTVLICLMHSESVFYY